MVEQGSHVVVAYQLPHYVPPAPDHSLWHQ
jgi:hypothetical protein